MARPSSPESEHLKAYVRAMAAAGRPLPDYEVLAKRFGLNSPSTAHYVVKSVIGKDAQKERAEAKRQEQRDARNLPFGITAAQHAADLALLQRMKAEWGMP